MVQKSTFLLAAIVMLLAGSLYFQNSERNIRSVPNCTNFDGENACQGQQVDNPDSWTNRGFQTPPRGDDLWKQTYQDYNLLQGYVSHKYSSDLKSVTLTINTRVNPKVSGKELVYIVNGKEQSSNTLKYDSSFQQTLDIKVKIVDSGSTLATLQMETVDFVWNHPTVNQSSQYEGGQKGAIVEMFGWTYNDIAKECDMLGKAGYMAVKVFPPSESILDYEHPEEGQLNPWYWLYQPVSYKLTSRQGTAQEFRDMINTCRSKNVRVYADAVVNHMAGNGNDMFPSHCSGNVYWPNKGASAGSPFYSQGFAYENWKFTGSRPGMEFPAVPYGPLDFHCARSLNSWTDGFVLNYGWLVNLSDLNTEKDYVRQRIADYIAELLSIGVSGVRIDAAKHISPDNLAAIFKKVADNMGGSLPSDFTAYLEVIIGGEKDLLMCNDNNYSFGQYFEKAMQKAGLSSSDINKIKIWSSDYPKEFPICGYWAIASERLAVENECHDDQNPGSSSRDMGDKGSVLIKERDVNKHREFEKQLFTRTDGNWKIKLILSSYTYTGNVMNPPDGHSDCAKCVGAACNTCTKSVPYKPGYVADACGYTCVNSSGQWVEGEYTRVHRDTQIINAMRKWMGLATNLTNEHLGLPSHC